MKKISRKKIQKILINEINMMVNEENEKREKYVKFCNFVLKENYPLLESKNYLTEQEVNKGILDTIMGYGAKYLGNLFPGFISDIKQKMATNLVKKLGLSPRSAFGRIIINTFEEIEYMEIMEYFEDWDKGCPKFIETFLRALSDSIVEYLTVTFLGAKNPEETSGVIGTARETFTTTLNNDLIPKIAAPISEFICKLDLSGIIQKIKDVATGKAKPEDIFKEVDFDKMMSGVAKSPGQGEKVASASGATKELESLLGVK